MALSEEDSLDFRVMAFADRMERNGSKDADSLRSNMAYIRECVRGADQSARLWEDLEILGENASAAAQTIRQYIDVE